MKQSVDLMNSMKRFSFRHSHIGFRHSNTVTGLARRISTTVLPALTRRALLLLTVLSMGVGNVWGATITTGTPATTSEEDLVINDNKFTINGAKFKELISAYPKYIRFTAYNSLNEKVAVTNVISDYRTYKSFGADGYVYGGSYEAALWTDDGVITVTLPDGVTKLEIYTKDQYVDTSGDNITEPNDGALVTYTLPVADSFESSLKEGGKKEFNIKEHDGAETSSATVDFSKALSALGGTPKYARFILKKNGAVIDPSGILTITDVTPAAQTTAKPKQGFYLYNSGNNLSTDGITITVDDADYSDYQVVCMLSTEEATVATENVVTEEPEWDLEYTYTFEKVETIPFANLGNAFLQLNKHSEALSYFGKGETDIKDSWYGRWSIRNKDSGATQPLAIGASQADAVWNVYASVNSSYEDGGYLGDAISGNYVVNNSGTELLYGATSADRAHRSIGYLQVYAPTEFSTMQGASDYEIVYEVTDEFTSGTPEFKLRYVFKIPAFENEPNTGMTEDTKPQVIANRSAASFTLGDMPTDVKYARFYLMDKDDNIIAPSTVLSLSGGTTCGKAESGIYLYNNGSVLSPTVTIAAPNAYKLYKVVGLFSTALDDINASGTTVNHEPKWDVKWTYTFDYTINPFEQAKQVEWDATAMEADATDTDIDANWNTSLAELAAGQCIKWWVKDGSDNVQPLAIGTARQDGTWTIGLPTGFAVAGNVATLSGMTSVNAGQLESWVKTNVYAPSEVSYADVATYKIVCEVYTNNAGTGNPNARYTFSIHKGFVGSLKSGATTDTKRILVPTSATTHDISVSLPTGTKYARIYLTTTDGTTEEPTGLSATDGTNTSTDILTTVDGYSEAGGSKMGYYIYNAAGLSSPLTVTFNPGSATLDAHHVVVMTSADEAVLTASNVTSEPDFDAQTTYWFKYPAAASKSLEAHVEWSAQSMQLVKPDIETAENLGAGYLENNKQHYTLQWFVEDNDGIQPLHAGSSRVNDYWSMNVNGDPFVITDKIAATVNNANLSSETWSNWAAPTFYAPKNKTMSELAAKNTRFVCRFFEDDQTPLDEANLLSMTYTVYIDRQEQLGELKDGGQRDTETLTPTSSPMTLSLADAQTAFTDMVGGTLRYARVYLAKSDGTPIDPTTGAEQLTITGATGFTTKEYGYYLSNEDGITLPTNNTLTLPEGKFNFYYVVVAMSGDAGETGHTGAFAPRRAGDVKSIYEPDYDLIYTIKFEETSSFPGTWIGEDGYKHAKEILVENESVTEQTISMSDNITKIKNEYEVSDFATLAANLHIRWFIAKKNDEGEYEKIPGSENYLTPVTTAYGHQTEADQGLYWNAVTQNSGKTIYATDLSNVLDVKFTKPTGGSWEDYRVYIYMKYKKASEGGIASTGQTVSGEKLTHEPNGLDMQYIYNFFIEDDANFQFVHCNGASNSAFMTHSDDVRLNATVKQSAWDNATGTKEAVSEDIRQGVHTVEYDIYVDPTSSTPVSLKLPFQDYSGSGNDLEPTAYIRWYDWTTDVNNNRLAIAGGASSYLEDKTENNNGSNVSRGFFLLNNSKNGIKPTHDLVGVTFNPNGVTGLVTIACDVSKYYDGIYSCNTLMDTRTDFTSFKKPYLMHEPTLSTRYIFNIRPASVIATDIQIGQDKLEAKGSNMFELAENNGRVSVAMKDGNTTFSVRANLSDLSNYYINNGASLLNCSKLQWYAYYEDESGIYRNDTKLATVDYDESKRISQIKVSALSGTYTHITNSTNKSVTAAAGQRFHLVGYIGDGTVMAPAVHYEVNLLNAPAYAVDDLPLERTEAYLREHMTLQATVDFDGKCGLPLNNELTSQKYNHSQSPMDWNEAQYGFCYPDVRRIWTGNTDYMGISPLHGDYMLLRSMNKSGVSETATYDYYYHWWASNQLLDYTYSYGLEHKDEYGSFLYVDASDESRTIAKMSFTADLCAGSELCFTGVVANMTSQEVQPQVMSTVYAVKNDNTRVRVVSFHSSDLSTVVPSSYTTGVWYQVYGRVAIPATVDLTNVDHYEVDIDNYSPGTLGADYAVDQLQFYTSTAKLKVKQSGANCGDIEVPLNLYVEAEQIEGMAGKTIFWRICDNDGNALTDASIYNNGTLPYGQTSVPSTIPDPVPAESSLAYPGSGYFIGSDGKVYFSLANKGFTLKEGENYYISVYSMSETNVAYETLWGSPNNTCSVYSPVFIPKVMYLTMEDPSHNLVTTVPGGCSDKKADINLDVVLNMPDDNEISGFKKYTIAYDYFLGTLEEARAYKITVSDTDYTLVNALAHYRNRGGVSGSDTYKTATTLESGYEYVNKNYYDVINKAIGEGKLFLSCSPKFNLTIQGDADNKAYVAALPTIDKVNNGTNDFLICSPLEFIFTVDASSNGPSLTLGFEGVTYPDGIRVVRVGKEQLTNMQKDTEGFVLHIPVNTFKRNDGATAKDGTLQIQGDLELLAYKAGAGQTSDDQIAANMPKVATFEATDISSTNMYIAVNFHGTGVTKPTFQEGFAYRMFFQYRDKDDATACESSTEFLLKVVPEFVTWNGASTEWNDDANWQRSTRTELYKGDKGSASNTNTAAHTKGYENNGEGTLSAVVTTPKTYVPMKFTYVTIPTGLKSPNLVDLTYDAEGIYNNIGAGATSDIQYDLMVRYTEKTCQDHSVSGDVYDCEKFYGNWAKELYLKPDAELLNQQYLTYEKVWVEKELTSNTWTLMSTPLQNTYAGDMYVPVSATAADNGRQISEAFQPITFSTTANAAGFTYSRTKYPIYQKGWTQQGVFVYTKTNDVRATRYSANIPGGVSMILNQWSHVYNDVTVPYSTWTAFAIRPHKQTQTAKTLIRLPKADTSYDYYQWDNTSPADGKLTQTVVKTTTGKLLTDGTANINGVTYGTVYGTTDRTAGDGNYSALVANIQSSPSNYQLVGNPYLCSIDMAKFLLANTGNLDATAQGYWTYDNNNTGLPITNGYIAPMQSFFVKVKDGATGVLFTPDMMVDGHSVASPAPAMQAPGLVLTAENEQGSSKANVLVGEGQNVETLFDSNLEDVPMVYTVANGYAVSINQVKELNKPIAFGVNCSSQDKVEVTFSDIEQLTNDDVFVVDAVDGKTQQIFEGDSFTVQPNDYGRYFLVFANGTTGIETTLPKEDGTEGEKVIFDLQGRRVIYPGKGVYIVNGKKVLMK